jgi:hypothetical protein
MTGAGEPARLPVRRNKMALGAGPACWRGVDEVGIGGDAPAVGRRLPGAGGPGGRRAGLAAAWSWRWLPEGAGCAGGVPGCVEQCRLAHNPEVAGSNPAPATRKCRSEA